MMSVVEVCSVRVTWRSTWLRLGSRKGPTLQEAKRSMAQPGGQSSSPGGGSGSMSGPSGAAGGVS